MAPFSRKKENPDDGVQLALPVALPSGVPRQDGLVDARAVPNLLSSVSPSDVYGSFAHSYPMLSEYGGSWWNESARYALYQKWIAPWLATPAGVAIISKIANKVASLPCYQVNEVTGKRRPIPEFFNFPLGDGNPSFGRRDFLKMCVGSLFRYGDCHILTTMNTSGRPTRLRPLDSTRLQTKGTFEKPYWILSQGALSWLGDTTENKLPAAPIHPNGRPHGMLHISWNRSPETNRGVPPGLLVAQVVATAVNAQDYAADYFQDAIWPQMLLWLKQGQDFGDQQEHLDNLTKQLRANHRVAVSALEVAMQRVGYSAEESQLVESRNSDQSQIAIAHGMPASSVSSDAASFAQIYADNQIIRTDVVNPIVEDLCDEFSRLLNKGWRFEMDRSALDRGDPRTLVDLIAKKIQSGMYSVNRGLMAMGDEPYGDPDDESNPYNRPVVDGNRVFLDRLEEILEAKLAGNKQPAGRPEEDDEEPEADYPETPSPAKS